MHFRTAQSLSARSVPGAPPASFAPTILQSLWLKLFALRVHIFPRPPHVVMSTDIRLLEQQRSSAKATGSHLTRLLKKARSREYACMRREEETAARRRRVGLAILASRPEGSVVLKGFLRAELVAESDERVDKEYEDIVDVFLQMSPDAIVGLTEPIAAEAQADLRAAIDFAVKWELRAWTSLQNRDKGVAPSVATMLQKKRKLSGDLSRSVGMAPRSEAGLKGRYKWLSTWRKSWKMPKGSFKHVDMPSVVDMRRKVRTGPGRRMPAATVFLPAESFCGPLFRRQNERRGRHSPHKNRGRKTAPILGGDSRNLVRLGDRFRPPSFKNRSGLGCISGDRPASQGHRDVAVVQLVLVADSRGQNCVAFEHGRDSMLLVLRQRRWSPSR